MRKEGKGMSLFCRIALRIRREKKKTGILLAAFFVTVLLDFTGEAFRNGINASLKELREQFPATLTIERAMGGNTIVSPRLAEKVVMAAKPDAWTGTNVYYLSMENISLLPGLFTAQGEETAKLARMISCRDSRFVRQFSIEGFQLAEGRHLTQDDTKKVIISKMLAESNHLSIGDKICGRVTDDVMIAAKQGIGTTYEYEIVGFFLPGDGGENQNPGQRAECDMYENYIFADEQSGFEMLENVRMKERQYINGIALWKDDPAELSAMYDNVISLEEYEWGDFYINLNAQAYEQSAEPMLKLEKVINMFMLIITSISILILIVLLTMWNHERIHEMAILLSVGCAKKDVLLQMVLENLVLFCTGYLLAVPVMKFLIFVFAKYSDFPGIKITISGFAMLGIAGAALTVLVTMITMIRIMRKPPKELLTEHI